MKRLNALLRLLEIRTVKKDRETFTNDIYRALQSRTMYERSLIIGDLRKRHHNDVELQADINERLHLETERALDISTFTIIN